MDCRVDDPQVQQNRTISVEYPVRFVPGVPAVAVTCHEHWLPLDRRERGWREFNFVGGKFKLVDGAVGLLAALHQQPLPSQPRHRLPSASPALPFALQLVPRA